MKFLIVDDDLINRKLLTALIKPFGACEIAINGKEAVDAVALSIKDNRPFEVIFLDIMMPEMNGHESLQQIRQLEQEAGVTLGQGAKVVMVTALGDSRNVLSAFNEGAEYYLVKPIQQKKLFELMEEMGYKAQEQA